MTIRLEGRRADQRVTQNQRKKEAAQRLLAAIYQQWVLDGSPTRDAGGAADIKAALLKLCGG
jgi:hypothetical protein